MNPVNAGCRAGSKGLTCFTLECTRYYLCTRSSALMLHRSEFLFALCSIQVEIKATVTSITLPSPRLHFGVVVFFTLLFIISQCMLFRKRLGDTVASENIE